jgi:hypothetical protein
VTTSDTTEIFKSLLQKSVRRGNIEMAASAVKFLTSHDFSWLRKRLAVLTFEECWTYGEGVSLSDDTQIVYEQILRLARMIKNRNAAGLGSLAFYYSQGDDSVLDGKNDETIKMVAEGFKHPNEYWQRIRNANLGGQQNRIVNNAWDGFEMAELPWDKCFMVAATYLCASERIPETLFSVESNEEFPLWAAVDKHTSIGHAAICRAARRIRFDEEKAQWLVFYLEGVKCNGIAYSPWWELEKVWRMKQLGIDTAVAEKIWHQLRPALVEELKSTTDALRSLL